MPALWSPEDFVDGGLRGITKFQGTLTDIEDDVEYTFDGGDTIMQIRQDFEGVEVLESVEPVKLDNGEYTTYTKQSARKNSVNQKMVADWVAFATKENIGPVPSCFVGKEMVWEQAVYKFGEGMSPGKAFIPIAFVNGSSPIESMTVNPVAIPDDLFEAIKEVCGEDGVNRDMIRSALVKKKTTREQLTALGGMDTILDSLVAAEKLIETDDLFIVA